MEKSKINLRFGVLSIIILLAAFSRLIPHPPNFAPVSAMALFGAAYFSKKHLALLFPIVAMWLSDLVLNNVVYGRYFDGFTFFYQGFYWTYSAFIIIGMLGFFLLKKVGAFRLILASISASILFFLISNFGVWASGFMYPLTWDGLLTCYTAALPFFQNTLTGDLVYNGVLFGSFELARHKFPVLQINRM
jgi:hypothetical protein